MFDLNVMEFPHPPYPQTLRTSPTHQQTQILIHFCEKGRKGYSNEVETISYS